MPQIGGKPIKKSSKMKSKSFLLLNATSLLLLEPKNTDCMFHPVHLPRPERLLANSAEKKKVRRLNFALKIKFNS